MQNFLDEQRDCYDRLSERAESWKAAHLKAMDSLDLQDAMHIGLTILANIRRHHEHLLEAVEQQRTPFSWKNTASFNEAYQWWLAKSRSLLNAVCACEREGYPPDNADEFVRRCAIYP